VHDRLYVAGKDGGYIALFSLYPLEEKSDEELIQPGVETGWAVVMGGEEYQNLEAFEKRMQLYELGKVNIELALLDNSDTDDYWALSYRGEFDFNGQLQDTDYPRLDSPFGHAERDPKEYAIRFGENSLRLDMTSGIREGEGI
jgi:hypothetical protein